MSFNIYITDASFDHRTKVGSVAVIDINKNQHHFTGSFSSPYQAEMFGLKKAVELAIKNKHWNAVFVSDNKRAIIQMKINKTPLNFAQFLWIPREFNSIADFLSKNIENEEELMRFKEEGEKARLKKIEKKALKNVMNLKAEKRDLSYRLKQLQALLNVSNIETKSVFLNKIKAGDFENLEQVLFSGDIIVIEEEKIEDEFILSFIKALIDIYIFV